MNPFRTAWRSGMGRPGKTGIWMLLAAFFTLASVLVFYVGNMAESYETMIIETELQYPMSAEEMQSLHENTDSHAWKYSGVAKMLMEIADTMLVGIYFTMLIVMILMSVMWMRDHGNDIGIYLVLGQSKLQIVLRLLLEMVMISLAAMVPFSVLGLFLVNRFGPALIMTLREEMGYHFYLPMQERDNTMLYTELPWQTAVQSGIFVLALLMIVVTILAAIAVRLRKASLFEQEH